MRVLHAGGRAGGRAGTRQARRQPSQAVAARQPAGGAASKRGAAHVLNLKPLVGSNLSTERCRPVMPSATRSCGGRRKRGAGVG